MHAPTSNTVLSVLPKLRLIALGRDIDIAVSPSATKDEQVKALVQSGRLRFHDLLRRLGRDELKAACRAHGLDDAGRARVALAGRLLEARKGPESAPPSPLFLARETARHVPRPGDIVLCRHRQWLVEDIAALERQNTRVRMVCLDDDNQGRLLEVLWELELGAKVHKPEAHGLGAIDEIDEPRSFGAYLHALKWNAVTATDGRLFQAPFRAGIQLQIHQLTPLKKALELPRANLFIADDVGLGKTIEAGLVLSELTLRQRVDLTLIICPASVCLQWRDEMAKRFGMHFEIMSRAFVAARRKERGFGVNPWATHQRFIVSHQLIRRPEYLDHLLAHLGDRARKSLLILDEAHVAAPAAESKYAVDSAITKVMRSIAPRFENRLFLSATPHNGHSNSFSALLEILDPQRFTRGVKVEGRKQLEPVMVRRLKRDLRGVGLSFPERRVIQFGLTHVEGHWQVVERVWNGTEHHYTESLARPLGAAEPFELGLAEKLARYTELARPERGRGKLVFISLQKRLLSSVEAFARTLDVHARTLARRAGQNVPAAASIRRVVGDEDDAYGADDDALEALGEAETSAQSQELEAPSAEAGKLLAMMQATAAKFRNRPDAKVLALLDWIRRHQCAAVRVGVSDSAYPGARKKRPSTPADTSWSDRRLLIFTEYGDTKRYLLQMLSAAIANTDGADARILQLHGGMGDEQREEVQRAFNAPPDREPVRILIATDAAREGINLQAHCADLVHFDVPWNPARMEQRNGRIDRTLQPSATVRCGYFAYTQRGEDPVLQKLVEKSELIAKELGSIGTVVMEDIAGDLERRGIERGSAARVDKLVVARPSDVSERELEGARKDASDLRAEIEAAAEIFEHSRDVLGFDPVLLREALDVGFKLAHGGALTKIESSAEEATYTVPALPESWASTLDTLRPARARDEAFWEWRRRPPLPVTFAPLKGYSSDAVHLHLSHPLVQRVLGRFLAQGYSMNDLSRVTVVRTDDDALVRVIAFGRLSLFGAGATRLHDELISVAARWVEGKGPLKPFADKGDQKAMGLLEHTLAKSPTLKGIPAAALERVKAAAPTLFEQLWTPIRDEADARAVAAITKLKARSRSESDALRGILEAQRAAIQATLRSQVPIPFTEAEREQRLQFERDKKHMEQRLANLAGELAHEPAQLESLYQVQLHRLTPVGLVVLWPATRS